MVSNKLIKNTKTKRKLKKFDALINFIRLIRVRKIKRV